MDFEKQLKYRKNYSDILHKYYEKCLLHENEIIVKIDSAQEETIFVEGYDTKKCNHIPLFICAFLTIAIALFPGIAINKL